MAFIKRQNLTYICGRFPQPAFVFEATNYTKKHEFVFKDNSNSDDGRKFQT
jgi:hypothetical protein